MSALRKRWTPKSGFFNHDYITHCDIQFKMFISPRHPQRRWWGKAPRHTITSCAEPPSKTPSLELPHAGKQNFCPLLSWVCPELLTGREAQVSKQKLATGSVRREDRRKKTSAQISKAFSRQKALKQWVMSGFWQWRQRTFKTSWRLLLSEGHLTLPACTCSHHIPQTVLLQNQSGDEHKATKTWELQQAQWTAS